MRVISLVPSWTETLVSWGVPVVGRTRYCIHPSHQVEEITSVGGTKKVDWSRVEALKPTLIVADKEENNKDILGKWDGSYHITHVQKLADMNRELRSFKNLFEEQKADSNIIDRVNLDIERWGKVLTHHHSYEDWQKLPGVIQWIKPPEQPVRRVLYVIWKDPWMAVARDTFIGSVFTHLGLDDYFFPFDEKYPRLEWDNYLNHDTLLLFSTEPYPFAKKADEIKQFPNPSAIVDGESYSWFGTRSLNFLEKL